MRSSSDIDLKPSGISGELTAENGQQNSESDYVYDWQWSKPVSIHQMKEQSSFPILICEQNGPRKKIFLVQKRVINYSTFIIIKEENPIAPHFLITNNCPNIRM